MTEIKYKITHGLEKNHYYITKNNNFKLYMLISSIGDCTKVLK